MVEKTIGIVGGVGPFAGLDLQKKILQQTAARKDQEHVRVLALSNPQTIVDRTEYLLGQVAENPARAFVEQLLLLAQAGANVAGIPCNTAHTPTIFEVIKAGLLAAGSELQLLHMIEETAVFLRHHYPHVQRVGILSTTGTYRTRLYPQALAQMGLTAVVPELALQERLVHTAVYHPDYGIKANGAATVTARANLLTACQTLQAQGAQAIILGCTEMPLAITETQVDDLLVVDPTLILARALLREANAAKLKPWPPPANNYQKETRKESTVYEV